MEYTQRWTGTIFFFFLYHLGIYNEDFTLFDSSRLRASTRFRYHPSLYTTQNLSHPDKKITPEVSTWFRMILTQLITWVYKDSSHFDEPTKYQYLTCITILIPTSKSFDTIITVDIRYHAFTYTYTGPTLTHTSNQRRTKTKSSQPPWDRLDLETLGFWPMMSNNLPARRWSFVSLLSTAWVLAYSSHRPKIKQVKRAININILP